MDVEEFRELGYLQEVNRRVLHPLGLALSVNPGLSREDVAKILRQADFELEPGQGELETIMEFVRILGLDKWHLSAVIDNRADPEGWRFAAKNDEEAAEFLRKKQTIDEEWRLRMRTRLETLGYEVQEDIHRLDWEEESDHPDAVAHSEAMVATFDTSRSLDDGEA